MFLPMVLNSSNPFIIEKYINELLGLNEVTKVNGLFIAKEEAKSIIQFRNTTLANYGRVDFSLQALKEIIQCFSLSAFIAKESYIATLNDLQELFYYLKNETADKIPDDKLINLMYEYFENVCGGSIDYLKSKLQEYADEFRRKVQMEECLLKAGDQV